MTRLLAELVKRAKIDAGGVARTGSRLRQRVRKITDAGPTARTSFIHAACAVASCALVCAAFIVGTLARAQDAAMGDWEKAAGGKMSFDVASVKEVEGNTKMSVRGGGSAGPVNTNTFPLDNTDRYSGDTTLFSGAFRPITYISFAYKASTMFW